MSIFILAAKVALLESIQSALIISFRAQTMNKTPLKSSHIIVICSYA